MLLEVKDLACQRGGVPVLEGVSFGLAAGAVLELRGPNGAGKTTLLRTLAGLQPPLAGDVVAGAEAIAYAAHTDGAKATLTVAENLTFWADVYGTRGIDPALGAFDLGGLVDRMAGQLSAGQRRRLGLARLLVTGRPVWLLDEPTVSLDGARVDLFAKVLSAHVAGGGAAVIATHLDLGLRAEVLDISAYRAKPPTAQPGFDEAFL